LKAEASAIRRLKAEVSVVLMRIIKSSNNR
jgi:hypothetical protein